MTTPAANTVTKPRRSRAEQREQTRARILQAALDIMIEDGIRSVRNRAVAKRAGVSLGSTTYHFQSIEELILSAFQYWREQALLTENPFFRETAELLTPFDGEVVPPGERPRIARRMLEISIGYLCGQLAGKREDRLLELAFHHESVRYPALHELVMEEWQAQLDYLTWVHRTMGSSDPETDARITTALFRYLEQVTVIGQLPEPDLDLVHDALHRHLSLCLGIEIPRDPTETRS